MSMMMQLRDDVIEIETTRPGWVRVRHREPVESDWYTEEYQLDVLRDIGWRHVGTGIDETEAMLVPQILRTWDRERVVRFARRLLGDDPAPCRPRRGNGTGKKDEVT
jgi:hypothetical protein